MAANGEHPTTAEAGSAEARGRAVILSPHLDDAVLSCWHLLSGERDVSVVNVFTGAPNSNGAYPFWDLMTGASDPRRRIAERIAEDREALALAGRVPVNLGFEDQQYRTGEQPLAPIVERLRALGEGLDADTALYAPAAIESAGADHVLVRDAALRLGEEDGADVRLYADLPHALRYGWPSWVAAQHQGLDPAPLWEAALRNAGLEPEALEPQVRELSSAERARKLEAILAYRTQSAALDVMFGGLTRPDRLAFEVTWRLGGRR